MPMPSGAIRMGAKEVAEMVGGSVNKGAQEAVDAALKTVQQQSKNSVRTTARRGTKNVGERIYQKAMSGQGTSIATNSFEGFINTFDKYTGVPTLARSMAKEKQSFSAAAEKAGYFTKQGENTKLNYGKIAGGYLTASAGVRIASGGGLYKDNQGATDLMGVPFF